MQRITVGAICMAATSAALLLAHFNSIVDTAQNFEWAFGDQAYENRQIAVAVDDAIKPELSRIKELLETRLDDEGFTNPRDQRQAKSLLRDLRTAVEHLEDAGAQGREAVEQLLVAGNADKGRALLHEMAKTEAALGAQAAKRAAERYRQLGALAFLNDTFSALRAYRRATELDPTNAQGWSQLGHLQLRLGSFSEARASFQHALALGNEFKNSNILAVAHNNLGLLEKRVGNIDEARSLFHLTRDVSKKLARQEVAVASIANLATLHFNAGKLSRSKFMFYKALKMLDGSDSPEHKGAIIGNIGVIYHTQGRLERAENMFEKQLKAAKDAGINEQQAGALGNLALVQKARGESEQAEALLRRQIGLARRLAIRDQQIGAMNNLGIIYQESDRLDRARMMYVEAQKLAKRHGSIETLAATTANLGTLQFDTGHLHKAKKYLLKALNMNIQIGRKEGIANNLGNLGGISHHKGFGDHACVFWSQARDIYEEIGSGKSATYEDYLKTFSCESNSFFVCWTRGVAKQCATTLHATITARSATGSR